VIPDERLSVIPIYYQLLSPDSRTPVTSEEGTPADWEMGGVALNDPSQGLMVKTWKFLVSGSDIQVGPDPGGPFTTLFTAPGTTEISGSFDQNMAPHVAYVQAGVTRIWWFNPLLPGYALMTLPGCTSPRLTIDDKRSSQRGSSDILLAYLRAGSLYYRQQRDRFATEKFLCVAPAGVYALGRFGMGIGLRVVIELFTRS
jgi:hypothetical protein